jgi:hypothetical protein
MSRENKFWDAAYDEATRYIKDKARDSDLRDAYYKMMSDRGWRCAAFNELIDVIADSEREIFRKYADDRKSDAEALEDAIADIVDGHFASVILADRKLADELSNRTYDQMKDAEERFLEVCRPSRGNRRRRDEDDRDDDRRDDYGGGSRRGSRDRGDRRGDRSSDDYGSGSRGERKSRDSKRRTSDADDSDPWSLITQLEDGFNGDSDDNRKPEREERPVERERERDRDRSSDERPHPDSVESLVHQKKHRVEGPDFTKADPFGEFWVAGEHWVVAHRSKWEITSTHASDDDDNAGFIPSWHDLNLYVKYYVKDADGNVREELEDVTKENSYLNQEVRDARGEENPERRSAAVSLKAARSTGDTLDHVDAPSAAPAKSVNLVDKLDEIVAVIPQLTEGRPVDSIVTATFAGRARMLADKKEVDVFLGYMRTPMNASDWSQMDLIDQVAAAPSLVAAAKLMNDLRPQFNESIWNKLNERFTEMVLRSLKYQFQFASVKQMNFAKNFEQLLGVIAQRRSAEFASLLGDRSRYITSMACAYASKEDVADTVGDLHEGAADLPSVVFLDFLEVISVDGSLDELGLSNVLSANVQDTGLSVTMAQQRNLSQSIRKIFEALSRSLPGSVNARVLLSTSDNYLIEVTPFSNRIENFVLSVIK